MTEGFEPIYRDLLWKFMDAVRQKNEQHVNELFELIGALRREYPEDMELFEKKYCGDKT